MLSCRDTQKDETARVNGLRFFFIDHYLPSLFIRNAEKDQLVPGITDPAGKSFTVPVKVCDTIISMETDQLVNQFLLPALKCKVL